MERVLQATAVTVSETWYEDGTAVDPATVTLTVTRADGTAVVEDAATDGTGAAARTYDLTPADTALLDTLTLTWTSSTLGSLVSHVEIVGDFLFSLADARALAPLNNTSTYSNAEIIAARTLAETALEDACGTAFVPRYSYETLSGAATEFAQLKRRPIRAIRSVSVDDTALTSAQLAALAFSGRTVYRETDGFDLGFSNVTVGYEHGMDYPPPRASRACLLLARSFLVDSTISDRATSISNEDGVTTFVVTQGVRGAAFNVPEANAVVQEYGWVDVIA